MEDFVALAIILFIGFYLGKFVIYLYKLFFTYEGRERGKEYMKSLLMKVFTIFVGIFIFILLIYFTG